MFLYGLGVIASLFVMHGYTLALKSFWIEHGLSIWHQSSLWLSLGYLVLAIPTLWVSSLRVWQYSFGELMFAQNPIAAHIMVGIGGAGMHFGIIALCFNNRETCWRWLYTVGVWGLLSTGFEIFSIT